MLVEAGVHRFAAGQYYAAHEAWETAWLAIPAGPQREVVRGLVQWAAARHKETQAEPDATQRSRNLRAAKSLSERAWRRILAGPETWAGLGITAIDRDNERIELDSSQPDGAIDGLLLGGGHGRRAGGPKALKPVEGTLLWKRQAEKMIDAGCRRVTAVIHPDGVGDEPSADPVTAIASNPDAPMFASLRRGLEASPGEENDLEPRLGILLLPVDCPMSPRPVVIALVARALEAVVRDQRWSIVRPRHRPTGRHGHPVLLAESWLTDLRAADREQGRLDHMIAALADPSRLSVEVEVDGVIANHNLDGVSR